MIRDHKEYTALFILLLCSSTSSFVNGMEFGIQIKSNSYKDDTLGWAAFHGNVEKATSLLQRGCQLTVAEDGSTPLHIAAYHNHLAVLRLLLTYPHYLPEENEVKVLTNQCSVEQLARNLTSTHFDRLKELLSSKTPIVSVPMTAYDAAWEKSEHGHDSQCRELLEPRELQNKLAAQVTTNYQDALKEIVEKANV